MLGGNFWDFVEKAQTQAKGLAELAQEKATVIIQQAQEMRQNYDLQVASDILMNGMGVSATELQQNGQSDDAHDNSARKPLVERHLDINYITENILTMSFPYDLRTRPRGQKSWNDINLVAGYLRQKHAGHYMIWNVSEDPYDYSLFDNQVLEYKFPGHPAPPLGLLFKICAAIESWIEADKNNVAIVHCLTGKGRTGSILACVLAWIGEFPSPLEALQYVADRRSLSIEELTIPSQRRYIQYFSNVLDGVKPRSDPLLLRRVIMNTIPNFSGNSGNPSGCCPYIQIFKNGILVANSYLPSKSSRGDTSASAAGGESKAVELKWCGVSEGSLSFHMDVVIHGDVLIRCRHIEPTGGKRESMFRAAFHTGYTPVGVLRLTKAQLDGCDLDDRFDNDFFVDFIFAPVEKRDANGKSISLTSISDSLPSDDTATSSDTSSKKSVSHEASDSGLLLDNEVASKYDEMLHRDGRFWDKIAMRKNRASSGDNKKKSRKLAKSAPEIFSIGDSYDQPTLPEASRAALDIGNSQSNFGLSSSASNRISEMSDMELILQLAEAEEGDFSKIISSDESKANRALSDGVDTDATVSKKQDTTGESELLALENFERELGLISSPAPSTGNAVSDEKAVLNIGGDSSGNNLVFEDNLDELEKYLQSLGNT